MIEALEYLIEWNASGQSQTENTELKVVPETRIKKLQNHDEILQNELEDFKNLHNNYMVQMQTIITQKAVEAPGAKNPVGDFCSPATIIRHNKLNRKEHSIKNRPLYIKIFK